jgi:putative aldouronate transport system substrate-binding protein
MKKTKIFSLIITATLVTSLMAGCGSQKNLDGQADSTVSDKSPITITMYLQNGTAKNAQFSDPIAKEITKETGVTLKIETPVANNDQVPLMIASGKYPDIIFGKDDTSKLVSAGALIPLDNYIKDCPNIQKIYSPYLSRLRYSLADPHIYTLGVFGVQPPGTELWNDGGLFQLQNAVLKDQGYPKLKTLNDYENAIKAYKAKYPTINGQKTIGLSLCADGWLWLCSLSDSSTSALGYPDNGEWQVDPKTCKAEYKFLNPAMKGYYKWLNKMNDEGLLDPDSFTQKHDQYIAKISSGRVLAVADASWDFSDSQNALNQANMPERTYIALPVVMNSKLKNASMTDMGYSADAGVGITKSCKNPKRVMEFLNWLSSDEGQVLVNWGIKGVNYDVINGKRVVTAAEKAKAQADSIKGINSGIGLYTFPFPQRADGVKDPTGNYYTGNSKESIAENYNSAMKETLKAYGATLEKDLYPPTSDFKSPSCGAAWTLSLPPDSDVTLVVNKADAVSEKDLPQIVMASPADFDEKWDDYQTELKSTGIEKTGTEFTKLLLDRVKLWNSK